MDATAEEDCNTIADLLSAASLSPVILDDSAPGVPEGTYEVQVPTDQAAKAEKIIAENPLPDEVEEVDDSPDLDLSEAIYHAEATATGELEALAIQNLLEANGIGALIVGDSVLPNFPFEVRVAAENADRARKLVEELQKDGPRLAEMGERESEQTGANQEP